MVEVAVIATPDPRWEERPLPCIAVDGATITIQKVRAHLTNQGFPSWQLPGEIRILDQLPKTSVGKPDKRALRECSPPTSRPSSRPLPRRRRTDRGGRDGSLRGLPDVEV